MCAGKDFACGQNLHKWGFISVARDSFRFAVTIEQPGLLK